MELFSVNGTPANRTIRIRDGLRTDAEEGWFASRPRQIHGREAEARSENGKTEGCGRAKLPGQNQREGAKENHQR